MTPCGNGPRCRAGSADLPLVAGESMKDLVEERRDVSEGVPIGWRIAAHAGLG